MGTQAHVIVVGGARSLAPALRNRIEELDRRWSRFRPDSELSQLNDHAGTPFEVSPDTRILIRRGIDGWHLSGGAFDPTILGALVRAGYDRTYEELDGGIPRRSLPSRARLRGHQAGSVDDPRPAQHRVRLRWDR